MRQSLENEAGRDLATTRRRCDAGVLFNIGRHHGNDQFIQAVYAGRAVQ